MSRLLILCCALLFSATTLAREPFTDPEDLIPVELATVGVDPFTGAPLVILREAGTGDVVPISIGREEALAIIRAMESIATPRPMTHDTTAAIIEAMGGYLERVMVDALRDNTYYGVLDIRREEEPDTPIFVDTRPSDGLALAVRTGASILVAPEVLQDARGREFEGLDDEQTVTALGITVGPATAELREQLALPDDPGLAVLRSVGQADELGIISGALILSVNGETPETPLDFLELVRGTESGAAAVIKFWHDGERREVNLDTDVPTPSPRTAPREPTGPSV